MSIFRLVISNRVRSAGSHAPRTMLRYYLREGRFSPGEETGERYADLRHVEQKNLPAWAHDDPYVFFQAGYDHERLNGRYARVLTIALPRELSRDRQLALIRTFTEAHLHDKPHVWALHEPMASDGNPQPHIHLVFSTRTLDGIERSPSQFFHQYNAKHPEKGGAQKDPWWAERRSVEKLRESWAILANITYEQAGLGHRVDHRNLYRQGIYREPAGAFGKQGDPRNEPEENTIASAHWEVYKKDSGLGDVQNITHDWLVEHLRSRAREGQPGRMRPQRTLAERERGLQMLDTAIAGVQSYKTRLHAAQGQLDYLEKGGKELTSAMQERHHKLLEENILVPSVQFEQVWGRATTQRILEEERTHHRGQSYER